MFRIKVIFAFLMISALGCYASTAPGVSFNPVSVSITGVPVGSTSAGTPVVLKNTGDAPLTINSIETAAPFAQINNCPDTLPATQACVIAVSFAPTASGKATGTLTVKDNAGGSPHTVPLTGDTISGMNLVVASSGQGSVTVKAGETATYSLNLLSVGEFAGKVDLSCTGLPLLTTCSFDPTQPNLTANGTVPITVSMKTTGSSAALQPLRKMEVLFALCGAICFGAVFNLRRKNLKSASLVAVVAFIAVIGILSCGGSKDTNSATTTPLGTYSVQVLAKSGSTEQGLNVSLTVQ